MNKELILEILNDWNFWKNKLETGIERETYVNKCLDFLKTNVVVDIIGVRRSGKSYIMRQTIKKLIEHTSAENTLMVNFEDKRFTKFYPEMLDDIYNTYCQFLKPDKKPTIFLDEIQNVPRWERWVRTMHELSKAKIVISGSSSKLLSGELSTVLTGRHLDIFTHPLSFKEFIQFKGIQLKNHLDIITQKIELKRKFDEYAEFGGFPEVALSKEKKQLLLTYFDDILTKDIEKRYKIRETEKLRALSHFYLTNISKSITFNSLKKIINTTTNTIEKFSSYLEEVNLIFFIKRLSFKVKEQEKSPRKVYSIDAGLANAIGFRFSENIGRIAENIVATELNRQTKTNPNIEIYYFQDTDKKEVDFVIKNKQKVEQLLQVCWNIDEYKTKEREQKALLTASEKLKCNNLLIITADKENEEKIGNKTIKYISLWKWLLI